MQSFVTFAQNIYNMQGFFYTKNTHVQSIAAFSIKQKYIQGVVTSDAHKYKNESVRCKAS